MVDDLAMLLGALQYGDSAFPSGGFAFSWGLEGLAADGLVEDATDVGELAHDQLVHRWNCMDRVLLRAAYEAAAEARIDAMAATDRQCEAATWSEPMRAGSKRAGRGLLGVHARLGHALAAAYRAAANEDPALGHLPVVQGLVFQASGLSRLVAEGLSGWAVVAALGSAAVRLGLMGHIEAQQMASSLRPTLAQLLRAEPSSAALSSFTPLADIAMARNPSRPMRMFAT
jgi:urease accessory protein